VSNVGNLIVTSRPQNRHHHRRHPELPGEEAEGYQDYRLINYQSRHSSQKMIWKKMRYLF
jgi:hypothetical protein